MTETGELNQRLYEWQIVQRETAARRRGYLIGAGVMAVIAVLITLLIWPIIDKNIYLRDDRGLGNSFRTHLNPSTDECERLAEAVYNHGIAGSLDYDHEGYAPRSEKAFFGGCTGAGYMPHD
jgi:hypothetical protein